MARATSKPVGPVLSVILVLLVLGGWEAAVRLLNVPSYLIPTPSAVAAAFWRGLSSNLY
jgi:NitT/TauT family transport system permease protein